MWWVGRSTRCYRSWFLPRFAPCGLLALLWTVVMMFAEMSKPLLSGQVGIASIFWVCVPLLSYFLLMFFVSWAIARYILNGSLPVTITFAFTAASNNFELALAACTAIFGTSSNQAVATLLGPLLEIPIMLALVKVAQFLAREPASGCEQSRPEDGQCVLLVHGFGASSYHWRYQVASLAEQGYRVYSMCLLGYGGLVAGAPDCFKGEI
eukprot:s1488_g7.t1